MSVHQDLTRRSWRRPPQSRWRCGICEIAVNASLAFIEGAKPRDEIECALVRDRTVAAITSAAARLLRAYATQVETLRRLRNGGSQIVRVEHVSSSPLRSPHAFTDEVSSSRGANFLCDRLLQAGQSSLQHADCHIILKIRALHTFVCALLPAGRPFGTGGRSRSGLIGWSGLRTEPGSRGRLAES